MSNSITLTGNLVDEPELVAYGDGQTLANLRIANNERVGEENRLNGYFDITVFGPQAKNVVASLHKGERIVATGRINQTVFEREDGSKGSRTKLVAQAIGLSLEFAGAVRTASPAAEPSTTEPAVAG